LRIAVSPEEKYVYALISRDKKEEVKRLTNKPVKNLQFLDETKEKVILKFDLIENKIVNLFKAPEGKTITRMILLGDNEEDHTVIMSGDFGIV